ncbi:MAG TPA: DUF1015 domain-containing protein [Bacillota bacterium]|mgnify:CR=1 FL=1|nr:DUF1015 domain-containing protein [Bacillota bacterium]
MTTIIPLRGLRYNPEKVKNLAEIVTPPYDVIDEAGQDFYYKRHPYNIIRLEYGKTHPDDNEKNNRYTRAAAEFSAWLKEGVLIQEPAPALYFYEQEFTFGGERKIRSGFICGVKLEPYEKGIVLPHEETMPKHKADRLELMRACRANFSPVFSLYADREMKVDSTLRAAVRGAAPDMSFTDENGETHRVWVITDPGTISAVRQAMADKRIFIADGHHRYETALNYKKEREEQGRAAGEAGTFSATASRCAAPDGGTSCPTGYDPAYNYVMMTLVNLYDPGLAVLPTHRLIKNVAGLDKNRLIAKIEENFTVEEYPLKPDRSNFQDFLRLLSERGRSCPESGAASAVPPHNHVYGLYTGEGRLYLLSLIDQKNLRQAMPPDKSPAWQGLDVSVLHTLIIEKHLGICGELRARAEHITYTREEEGALAAVDGGEYQLAFFVNPTLVEEVTEVAAKGEKMPQKSTFFYPKLVAGLVVNRL